MHIPSPLDCETSLTDKRFEKNFNASSYRLLKETIMSVLGSSGGTSCTETWWTISLFGIQSRRKPNC